MASKIHTNFGRFLATLAQFLRLLRTITVVLWRKSHFICEHAQCFKTKSAQCYQASLSYFWYQHSLNCGPVCDTCKGSFLDCQHFKTHAISRLLFADPALPSAKCTRKVLMFCGISIAKSVWYCYQTHRTSVMKLILLLNHNFHSKNFTLQLFKILSPTAIKKRLVVVWTDILSEVCDE